MIVALNLQLREGPCSVFHPSRIWWLEMNEAADTIVSAGPLTGQATDDIDGEMLSERYPSLAIRPGGEIQLVYPSPTADENDLRLHSARLGFDASSGRPRVESGHRGSPHSGRRTR